MLGADAFARLPETRPPLPDPADGQAGFMVVL